VLNKSLTVVLPVYNGASRLRAHVRELLELASELTNQFGILIVDDGSTDATYEVAADLAARYPQVSVRRHRHRSGLGPTIEHIQRHVRSDAVIMHDGVTPIDANQMRTVWRRWVAGSAAAASESATTAALHGELCDLADLPAIHATMERAHGKLLGFQLLAPRRDRDELACDEQYHAATARPRTDEAHLPHVAGVGRIPRLPRPKFVSAVATFALGE
jgi:cellulose synthase/poly-beta-1,6-N-acetylglucosamine synthase-like glycosyltransferase